MRSGEKQANNELLNVVFEMARAARLINLLPVLHMDVFLGFGVSSNVAMRYYMSNLFWRKLQ